MLTVINPPYSRTVCPSRTRISLTAPARGASTGISIFIDSSTITASPAATRSPGFVVIWKTTPVMCALISSAIEGSLFEQLRVDPARAELVARDDPAKERNRRLRPLDDAPVESPGHPRQRLLARGAVSDELEEQGIVVHGHRAPHLHAGLDPDTLSRRQVELRHRPRRGPGRDRSPLRSPDARLVDARSSRESRSRPPRRRGTPSSRRWCTRSPGRRQ